MVPLSVVPEKAKRGNLLGSIISKNSLGGDHKISNIVLLLSGRTQSAHHNWYDSQTLSRETHNFVG